MMFHNTNSQLLNKYMYSITQYLHLKTDSEVNVLFAEKAVYEYMYITILPVYVDIDQLIGHQNYFNIWL